MSLAPKAMTMRLGWLMWVFLLAGLNPGQAQAQRQVTGQKDPVGLIDSMTLEQAMVFARDHHPRLKAEVARVALAEERAREPGQGWFPRIGATVQVVGSSNNNSATNWLGSRGAVEFPRIAGTGFLQAPSDVNWKPYLSTAVGLSAEQRLFDFGRIAAETAAADALAEAQRARKDERELGVDLGVRESYYATRAAHSVLEVARQAAHRASLHHDEAHARVAQGVRPRIEDVRAEADLARFEVGVLRAEAGLYSAEIAFGEAVGRSTPLDAIEGPEAAGAEIVPSLDAELALAAQHDPSVRDARLRLQAAHERAHAAAAQLRPDLWAVASVMGAAGGAPRENSQTQTWGAGAVPWVPDYFAGVVLAWRFFDPVANARTKSAEQETHVSEAELESTEEESLIRVQQAWVRADVSTKALRGLERSVTAARANYEQAEVRFESGLGTSVELADAEALRTSAEVELALGRFEVSRAQAQLLRVVGGS